MAGIIPSNDTYYASSWKNFTKAMTGFLKAVITSLGTREFSQTSPGHQQLPHFTQTTSPSLYGDSDMIAGSRQVSSANYFLLIS